MNFFENGNISIKFESDLLLDHDEINSIIKESVNDYLLEIIRKIFETKRGTIISTLIAYPDKNIEINKIDYQYRLENTKRN